LRINTTLVKLYLSYNKINNSGGKAIADTLHYNTTLTMLDISRNNIEDSVQEMIKSNCNSTLQILKL
jgi:hypothetical protein